ncbi:hypothetical protein [Mycolicibacterium fortuitum]|uniref:hypothetical protein n=1 Tax=Mycolicibacterium fortuitum TaxID=1766 RepID=UPI0007EAF033|nr:hypothetical protein [Mycolicibacterium fortuitum]OBF77096.1 hypothetical protein A5751_23245 [Mycolicibacterium fortuitum]
MTVSAKKSTPRKAPAKKAAEPKPQDATPAPESGVASLYPKDTPLFEYQTKSGLKVAFPKITSRELSRQFWWSIYKLDPVFQGFAWMDEFEVPAGLQALVVALPDDEYEALFDAWYSDAGLTPGETAGE